MATQRAAQTRSRRAPRLHPVVRTVSGHWLLILTSHTVAVVILLFVDHLLHPSWCGQ